MRNAHESAAFGLDEWMQGSLHYSVAYCTLQVELRSWNARHFISEQCPAQSSQQLTQGLMVGKDRTRTGCQRMPQSHFVLAWLDFPGFCPAYLPQSRLTRLVPSPIPAIPPVFD